MSFAKLTAYTLAIALSAGCATTGGLRQARQAEDIRDYDLAVARRAFM